MAVRRQANKIETQQRRDWVVRELAASRPRHEIAQVMRSEWGLSDSQVSRYLKRGQEELIAAVGATDRVQLMAQLIASMQTVMRRSIASDRFSDAIGAARLISQVTGLLDARSR